MEHQRRFLPRECSGNTVCNEQQGQWHRLAGQGAKDENFSHALSGHASHTIPLLTRNGHHGSVHGPPEDNFLVKETAHRSNRPSGTSQSRQGISSKDLSAIWRPSHHPERSSTVSTALQRSNSMRACLRPCMADWKWKRWRSSRRPQEDTSDEANSPETTPYPPSHASVVMTVRGRLQSLSSSGMAPKKCWSSDLQLAHQKVGSW